MFAKFLLFLGYYVDKKKKIFTNTYKLTLTNSTSIMVLRDKDHQPIQIAIMKITLTGRKRLSLLLPQVSRETLVTAVVSRT